MTLLDKAFDVLFPQTIDDRTEEYRRMLVQFLAGVIADPKVRDDITVKELLEIVENMESK